MVPGRDREVRRAARRGGSPDMNVYCVSLRSPQLLSGRKVRWQIANVTRTFDVGRSTTLTVSYDHATQEWRGRLVISATDELDAYVATRKYLGDQYADP